MSKKVLHSLRKRDDVTGPKFDGKNQLYRHVVVVPRDVLNHCPSEAIERRRGFTGNLLGLVSLYASKCEERGQRSDP
ncbi:hypothetical protein SLA2020_381310 [Shorea laevis]